MPSHWRHSIWNANAESWESCGGNSFATRKYLHSLVHLPSTTSSDIVASPSLATLPDCRTAPQHIKPYSLTSTSHSVVFLIPPGVVGLVAHVADGSTKSETTPADLWRQALGRSHRGWATRRPMLAMRWWWWVFAQHVRVSSVIVSDVCCVDWSFCKATSRPGDEFLRGQWSTDTLLLSLWPHGFWKVR